MIDNHSHNISDIIDKTISDIENDMKDWTMDNQTATAYRVSINVLKYLRDNLYNEENK